MKNLGLTPKLDANLFPGVLISGSSKAGREAAKRIEATAIKYPEPASNYSDAEHDRNSNRETNAGVRIGLIARHAEREAWKVAHSRFPPDRKGQLTHQLAMKTSDSVWHKQLAELAEESAEGKSPYWLHPFQNYRTFCPYLVGNYEAVSNELARYITAGFETFILDVPPNEEELDHVNAVFGMASRAVVKA